MANNENLFRKEAIDKLSSPEDIDQIIQVTDSKGWVALGAIFILILVAILWSIFGSIPTKIYGTTILTKTGGLENVTSSIGGEITDISVAEDDMVRHGDVIARIERPELLDEIYSMQKEKEALTKRIDQDKKNRLLQKSNLESKISVLKKRKVSREELEKEGLVTQQSVLAIGYEIKEAENALRQLNIEDFADTQKISTLERNLDIIRRRYEKQTEIVSPYTGRVLEVKQDAGDIINPGTPIISIERTGKDIKDLEAVIYVPSYEGKRIRPGMDIQISLASVKKEEYGSLLGKVVYVPTYPSTFEAIMKVLENEMLVRQILNEGPAIQIVAYLTPDPNTFSGYKWTTPKGAPIKIQPGTIGGVFVTVKKQRPISLVIPFIKRVLGSDK